MNFKIIIWWCDYMYSSFKSTVRRFYSGFIISNVVAPKLGITVKSLIKSQIAWADCIDHNLFGHDWQILESHNLFGPRNSVNNNSQTTRARQTTSDISVMNDFYIHIEAYIYIKISMVFKTRLSTHPYLIKYH